MCIRDRSRRMPNRSRMIRKHISAVTACGGCSRLWCLTTRHMHRSQLLRNWNSKLLGEFYKSCLLDSICDMILSSTLSSKVCPAFFDRSERTLNTHARLDELLHERNMTLYQLCQSGNIPYTTLRVSRCRGSQLSVDTIEQICKVLGISMAEFFTVHAETKSMNDRVQ